MPKRILFLAYHFPPVGGAGAQRPARLVRHLPDFGYEPIVVTGPGTAAGRWTPTDPTLQEEVPAGTSICRVPGPEPGEDGTGDRIARWLGTPSPWARWWVKGAVEAAARAGSGVDIVYAWMQPYPTAVAGARLAARLGRPWVADLGDPWALDDMIVWPSRAHRRWEERRMGRTLSSAAAIVMSTPEAARRLRDRFPDLAAKPILAIPNGFEVGDFEEPVKMRGDGMFRIVHTGYLHTDLNRQYSRFAFARRLLGGRDPGVNIGTRSHVYLLESIDRIRHTHPEIASRIELHFAGVLAPMDLEVAERSAAAIKTPGYLDHGDAIALMRSADLLFLPMHDLPEGRRATIVPGKTYEYLAAGPPILAAVPDGDARDLLLEAGNASVCRPGDVGAMADALVRRFQAAQAHETIVRPAPGLLQRFEYRQISSQLAEVFDSVVAVGQPVGAT